MMDLRVPRDGQAGAGQALPGGAATNGEERTVGLLVDEVKGCPRCRRSNFRPATRPVTTGSPPTWTGWPTAKVDCSSGSTWRSCCSRRNCGTAPVRPDRAKHDERPQGREPHHATQLQVQLAHPRPAGRLAGHDRLGVGTTAGRVQQDPGGKQIVANIGQAARAAGRNTLLPPAARKHAESLIFAELAPPENTPSARRPSIPSTKATAPAQTKRSSSAASRRSLTCKSRPASASWMGTSSSTWFAHRDPEVLSRLSLHPGQRVEVTSRFTAGHGFGWKEHRHRLRVRPDRPVAAQQKAGLWLVLGSFEGMRKQQSRGSAISPPDAPVNPIAVIPLSRHCSSAAITLRERPDVEMPTNRSPDTPSACTWRANA